MVLTKKISSRILIAIVLFLSLGIFVIDLQTPLGIADGFIYLAVLLLTLWSNNKIITITSAITSIVLIIGGYFFSPSYTPTSESLIAITNRLVSILVVIICAFLIIKFKRIEQEVINQHSELEVLTSCLQTSNLELEQRVKERTSALEASLENLNKSESELQKSLQHEKELNELKSRFVTMASHEFRTPLATILTSLNLISKYAQQNQKEKQLKHIDRIKNSIVHLTTILEDMLSLSKLEEGKTMIIYENISVYDIVLEIIKEFELKKNPNQKIEYNHYGTEEVICDKKILTHILLNLISNALKFSNENGIVEIKTEADKSLFKITVKDSGIGIPEEDQKYMFERFFRGSNASAIQGTGLGLNIVSKYVELMKGKIKMASKLGIGTTFITEFNLN